MSDDDAMRPPVRPGLDHAVGLVEALWPAGTPVRLMGRRSVPAGSVAFIPVPSAARPQLLLPAGPRRSMAAAVRRSRVAMSTRATVVSAMAAATAASGLLRLHPQRVVAGPLDASAGEPGQPGTGLVDRISDRLGVPLVASLYIGPVRAVQKPVVQLIDLDGRTRAFAKVGINAYTNALVAHEAASLERLASLGLRRLQVPRLLMSEQWLGHEVLVQEALEPGRHPKGPPAGPTDAAEPPQDLVVAASVELANAARTTEPHLVRSPWLAALERRVSSVPRRGTLDLTTVIEELVAVHGAEPVDVGLAHTDWAPWNRAVTTQGSGRVLAWDWEQLADDVPVGLDAIHDAVQRAVVLGSTPPAEAVASARRDAARLLNPYGVPQSQHHLLVTLYVLDLASRYLETGETGTRLSRLDTWLADSLADSSSSPVSTAQRRFRT